VEVDAGTGEIVGTNLYNSVNGFVRYRMTDTAAGVETTACPACRRQYVPIIPGIDGRQEDFIYSRERGWIPPAIVTYPLKGLHDICGIQFQQDDPDEIRLNYFLRPGVNRGQVDSELKGIESGLRRLVGGTIRLSFQQVDDIPRGPTGKFKWIVSKLNPQADVIKSRGRN
jgi:phenylacetate-CoA ligase